MGRMAGFLKRVAARLRSRRTQLALAVRVTVAAVVAYTIANALHLTLPLWAVLTSLIVTQMSVGRSLKATTDYMLGTIGGAIYGGALAVLIPHSGEAALLALLVLTVAPLAYLGSLNPSLTAATVTGVIVLLIPEMHHTSPLDSVIDRLIEVTVGASTGLAASFLVLPSRAHRQIRANAARLIELIAGAFSRIAGWPDAWPRQRRAAPDPGWHRCCGDGLACDGAGSRARTRGAAVIRAGHRPAAADHPAAAS